MNFLLLQVELNIVRLASSYYSKNCFRNKAVSDSTSTTSGAIAFFQIHIWFLLSVSHTTRGVTQGHHQYRSQNAFTYSRNLLAPEAEYIILLKVSCLFPFFKKLANIIQKNFFFTCRISSKFKGFRRTYINWDNSSAAGFSRNLGGRLLITSESLLQHNILFGVPSPSRFHSKTLWQMLL